MEVRAKDEKIMHMFTVLLNFHSKSLSLNLPLIHANKALFLMVFVLFIGKFVVVPKKVPEFVVPDLTGFQVI